MRATGPSGGAGNSTYYAAFGGTNSLRYRIVDRSCHRYVYFEKVRIATGKKKTAKRLRNEKQYHEGMSLEERRGMWVKM